MITQIRDAITANGGTPQSFVLTSALRELVTAYGGTPTKHSATDLLREAITAVGGTPTKHTRGALLKELVAALGGTPKADFGQNLDFVAVTAAVSIELNALALDDSSHIQSISSTSNISGATAGSTISVLSGSLPAGMSLNSGARSITGRPTTSGTANFTLRESLEGVTRDTALSITITDNLADTPTFSGSSWVDNGDGTYTHEGISQTEARFGVGQLVEGSDYRVRATVTGGTLVSIRSGGAGATLVNTPASPIDQTFTMGTTGLGIRFTSNTDGLVLSSVIIQPA